MSLKKKKKFGDKEVDKKKKFIRQNKLFHYIL